SMLQYIKDIKCDKSSDFYDKIKEYKEEKNIYQIEDILNCLDGMIQEEQEEIKELKTKIECLSTTLEELIKEEEKAFNTNLDLEELKALEIKQKELKSKEAKIHNLEIKGDLAQYALTKIKPFESNKNMKENIRNESLKKVEEGKKEKKDLE